MNVREFLVMMFNYLFSKVEPELAEGWRYFRGKDTNTRTRWVTFKGEGHIYTLREQNVLTPSRFATLAREQGYRIAWLFIDGKYAEGDNLVVQEEKEGEIWTGNGMDYP